EVVPRAIGTTEQYFPLIDPSVIPWHVGALDVGSAAIPYEADGFLEACRSLSSAEIGANAKRLDRRHFCPKIPESVLTVLLEYLLKYRHGFVATHQNVIDTQEPLHRCRRRLSVFNGGDLAAVVPRAVPYEVRNATFD